LLRQLAALDRERLAANAYRGRTHDWNIHAGLAFTAHRER
jgi:hypothetical protein